jgi:hypothetical protein
MKRMTPAGLLALMRRLGIDPGGEPDADMPACEVAYTQAQITHITDVGPDAAPPTMRTPPVGRNSATMARNSGAQESRFDPARDRQTAVAALVAARKAGATLRQAAAAADVHVATVCRWLARSPEFAGALDAARREARHRRFVARPRLEPRNPDEVPWHPLCPMCGAGAEVRRSKSGRLFWWGCVLRCGWASWRPRHPRDCPMCGGPRYWAHSRRSVSCPECRARESV